ncbi:hypothetical protein [Rhodococcus gannanensis]|uniref:RES domain-containing protein n=1 Tax=Rhodococcus gannanensis TaxID=1960308 RepID=A0ABW4P7Q4_9NOCA
MTSYESPEQAALATVRDAQPWPGGDERFTGYGVMGLPFDSGHYLAFRHYVATTVGPAYRTVWHRAPDGTWSFYSGVEPETSCPRYFAASTATRTVRADVDVTWDGPFALRITIPDVLEWRLTLASTPATATMSAIGSRLPVAAWRSQAFLKTMEHTARPLMRTGRIGLCGTVPNGQRFGLAPRLLWAVTGSGARLGGADLGSPRALDRQDRLGDFWLPQRGLFAIGDAEFETFDPDRHRTLVSGGSHA